MTWILISRPISLNCIREKLDPNHMQHYQNVQSFLDDCRLLFTNAFLYYGSVSVPSKIYLKNPPSNLLSTPPTDGSQSLHTGWRTRAVLLRTSSQAPAKICQKHANKPIGGRAAAHEPAWPDRRHGRPQGRRLCAQQREKEKIDTKHLRHAYLELPARGPFDKQCIE